MTTTQWQKDAAFPQNHQVVTTSDTVNFPDIRPLYCSAPGNVAAVDKNDTVIIYAVTAGQLLPIMPKRVNATNTSVAAGSLIQFW